MAKRKRKRTVRVKVSWREFRASLSLAKKIKLIRVIGILWPSASKTAKNKAIKLMKANVRKLAKRTTRKTKRKTRRKTRRKARAR